VALAAPLMATRSGWTAGERGRHSGQRYTGLIAAGQQQGTQLPIDGGVGLDRLAGNQAALDLPGSARH
jgi:hypothetical protein